MKFAVIKTGGKQYVVKENDEIVVDLLPAEKDTEVEFEKLAEGDDEKDAISLGTPLLKTKVKGTIIDNVRGDKLRVVRYKAKVRYRKVTGFRAELSRVRITAL